jgi:hypothetical protein
MKRYLFLTMLTILALAVAGISQNKDEKEQVKLAVLDYVEGIYEVDASRIERSVHPELAKRGFFIKKGETGYSGSVMTYQQLVELAKTYNKGGRVPKNAPKEVVIYDVSDQTATVKLTAIWGIDYMHLAKYEGKWKIINVLWQTPPPRPNN